MLFDRAEHQQLVSFAGSIVGWQNAEDIVQEYYLKFLTKRVRPCRHQKYRLTWAMAIIKYTAFRWLVIEERVPYVQATTDPRTTVHDYDDLLDLLAEAEALPPAQRELLAALLSDTTQTPIEQLQISDRAFRNRLYRAKQFLQERNTYLNPRKERLANAS